MEPGFSGENRTVLGRLISDEIGGTEAGIFYIIFLSPCRAFWEFAKVNRVELAAMTLSRNLARCIPKIMTSRS